MKIILGITIVIIVVACFYVLKIRPKFEITHDGRPQKYNCTSEAKFRKGQENLLIDIQQTQVDFSIRSESVTSVVKHAFSQKEIYVEFWSNDSNHASATAFIKGLIFRTQWQAGFGSSDGLPASFEFSFQPYEFPNKIWVDIKVTCEKI